MIRKSYNLMFIVPTVLLLSVDMLLLSYILKNHIWAVIAIILLFIFSIVRIIAKFTEIPHPIAKYGNLEEADFEIPGNDNIKVFLSSEMGKFDFLGRIAELTSPISSREESRLILNKILLDEKGKRFIQIAGTRELLKYDNRIQLKNYLGVALPILITIGLALAYFAFSAGLYEILPLPMLSFLFPFLLAILFVGSLFCWNSSISKRDFKIDREMLNFYRMEEIEFFIKEEEKIISKGDSEKSKVFNDHFSKERISRLHSNR